MSRQRTKTHCLYGHEMTEENTYYRPRKDRPNPDRACQQCRSASWGVHNEYRAVRRRETDPTVVDHLSRGGYEPQATIHERRAAAAACFMRGFDDREIAGRLGLSVATIERYRSRWRSAQ